ncbi:MAG: dihydroorotate dehydrogenase (quinone), partial [Betaproteobacteria bacterium]|nr:dihydroorotate dehydrogenase (quinone) [Betaproteobacteria bacterium]
RMGFNNAGVDRLVANAESAAFRGVLGINIGKNFDTPIERAADDYVHCLKRVYRLASYVTINISSPNTRNLRQLQESRELGGLLAAVTAEREKLADQHGRRVPLALKIAPDLEDGQIDAIAELAVASRIDAIIATNTTISRDGVAGFPHADEAGGLSGAPLTRRSTYVVSRLARALAGTLPVIGVGGIMSAQDAAAKIVAGASLVQIYTGLIYRGPQLVSECVRTLCGNG